MKHVRSILAGLLAVIMTVSMLPSAAFASEAAGNEPDPADTVVTSQEYAEENTQENTQEAAEEEVPEEREENAQESAQEADSAEETEEQAPREEQAQETLEKEEEASDPQAQEEQQAEVPAAEPDAEPAEGEQTPAAVYTLEARGRDYVVTITYDTSSGIPEGSAVRVEEIFENSRKYDYDDYLEQAADAVEAEVEDVQYARLFDISVVDADGKKVELDGSVDVRIRLKDVEEVQESMQVVHFAEESTDVIEPEVDGNNVAFTTEGFSVYVILDIEDDDPRMEINFYDADTDSDPMETMYVKAADLTDAADLAKAVFDPGSGRVPSGLTFFGWSIDEDDYPADSDQAKSIEDVRAYIAENFDAGSSLDVYGVYLAYYTVSYIDNTSGTSVNIGKDTVYMKEANAEIDYTVYMDYDYDPSYEFNGWMVLEGSANIVSHQVDSQTLFDNGTQIRIKGDVKFSLQETQGYWLIFHENGKNASYNAPRFYHADQAPSSAGLVTERKGYTFLGWFEGKPAEEGDDPTGAEFTFPSTCRETKELYAKWRANTTAEYTVILWLETLTDNVYDFDDSYTFTGTVGSTISNVRRTGSGNDCYAVVDGVEKKRPGFNCQTFGPEMNKKIACEGDTVFNVYYKRNTYTLRFYPNLMGAWGLTSYPITAKYGAFIGDQFPAGGIITRNNLWRPSGSAIFTDDLVYINNMPAENTNFYLGLTLNFSRYLRFYAEVLPGESITSDAIQGPGDKWYKPFSDEVSVRDQSITEGDIPVMPGLVCTWETTDPQMTQINSQGLHYYDTGFMTGANTTVKMFYQRLETEIKYFDGVYFDGDDQIIKSNSAALLHTDHLTYGASMTALSETGDHYYEPELEDEEEQEEYIFEGWYKDRNCTEPFNYNLTVPATQVNLYAKWRQIQYRVFLHPNAGTQTTNPTLDWGGTQSMCFRVSYDELVSLPTGKQVGYEFLGWYFDPDFTRPIYASYLSLVGSEDLTDYHMDNADYYTDDMDDWGNGATYNNDDADHKNRTWIKKKFEAYAKWKRTVQGANGISIAYDANGGSNAPTDNGVYGNEAQAAAGNASTPPSGKVFQYWVVQEWNGTAFVDTDPAVTVAPGQRFTVHVEDACITDLTDPEHPVTVDYSALQNGVDYTYVIQLRAEYKDEEAETLTDIKWYKNDGTGGLFHENQNVRINNSVSVPGTNEETGDTEEIPERKGYKFLGWAIDAESANGASSKTQTDISFDETEGYEYLDVAANDLNPSQAFYAVWEKLIKFSVYHSSDNYTTPETLYMTVGEKNDNGFDLTDKVKSGYLYGGYSLTSGGNLETASSGKSVKPEMDADAAYYLREIDDNYLKPQVYITYYKNYAEPRISKTYALANIDDSDYYNKFILTVTEAGEDDRVWEIDPVYDEIRLVKEGSDPEPITFNSLFGSKFPDASGEGLACESALIDLEMDRDSGQGRTIELAASYVTRDNVKVTGVKHRIVVFGNGCYYDTWAKDASNKGIKSGMMTLGSKTEAYSRQTSSGNQASGPDNAARITKAGQATITAPTEKKQYTVTKVIDAESEEQTVEEGDRTGQITYPDKPGFIFAGWYLDRAFNNPADFSDISADMTVYARYISQEDISVSFARTSNLIGKVPFDVTVSVKASALPDDIEIHCVKGSDVADTALTKTTKQNIGTRKKPVYVYKHQGTVRIPNMGLSEEFTAQVIWTTPDGTRVEGVTYTIAYQMGTATVQ